MAPRAVILGCLGPALGPDERRFLAEADPWGFILFARNVADPDQVRRLTADLRAAVGRDAPVLIDQEGGRVARLRAPRWREWVPALDECARQPDAARAAEAMRLRYRLIASELAAVGIDVDAAPVLDLVHPETHAIIRNRAYGADPAEVAAIGRAVADGLLAEGVLPVMKHIPGHGRATVDSHLGLPRVGADRAALDADFAAFRALADLPMAMSAHVVFEAIDPDAPATLSPAVVRVIREEIGFDGLLMTDDLSMRALDGPFRSRAERAISAGADMLLHCNGDLAEAAEVVAAAPRLAGRAAARAEAALALRGRGTPADPAALEAAFAAMTGASAGA
ncbi:beta-N-acetylhexosaminidase [Amaricoccus sp.]|uniref:beta-N-acetylhexosaminidase n=1 Tax=Amaricoccus sp. TaxID=1872485 RepID=UPI001B4122DA|nr:beta-N-acetylhexosaminidase [Amaricoccus sp.]MBP7242026.1 beta-N-acetylhexosaminidase [Amaricoccus sp.]